MIEGPMVDFERRIGRVLIALTYVAVGLLVLGAILMAAHGIGPLDLGPTFDPGSLPQQLVALDPSGPLWLGTILVIVAPMARVFAAGVAYAGRGQWTMVAIAAAILVVIALGVGSALLTET